MAMAQFMNLPDLLVEWGFPELLEIFQEQEFDVDSFLELDDKSLAPYLPKHGPRLKFLKRLRNLKETFNQEPTVEVIVLADANSLSHGTPLTCTEEPGTSTSSSLCSDLHSNESAVNENSLSPVSSHNSQQPTAPAKRRYLDLVLEDTLVKSALETLDVKAVLEQDSLCTFYLTELSKGQVPDGDWRNTIVNVHVSQSLLKISLHLTHPQLRAIAQNLVDVLPGENLATYYYDGNRLVSEKLVDKYNNLKAKLKNKERCIPDKSTDPDQPPSASRNSYTPEERQQSLAWLRFIREPWPEVRRHWEVIYQDRLKLLHPCPKSKKKNNIENYYYEFPVLTDKAGWQLMLYPYKTGCLFACWPLIQKAIESIARQFAKDPFEKEILSKLLNLSNVTESATIIFHLMLLPFFFKTNTSVQFHKNSDNATAKKFWKPTLAEQRDDFILHVKDPSDIRKSLESRQNLMAKLGLNCQPLVEISGPTLCDFTHCQMWINGILYTVPGPLQAVDVAFKSFQVLSAWYPVECEQPWLFIPKTSLQTSNKI